MKFCIRTPKPVTRTFISCDVGGDVGSIAGWSTTPTSPMAIPQLRCYNNEAVKEANRWTWYTAFLLYIQARCVANKSEMRKMVTDSGLIIDSDKTSDETSRSGRI